MVEAKTAQLDSQLGFSGQVSAGQALRQEKRQTEEDSKKGGESRMKDGEKVSTSSTSGRLNQLKNAARIVKNRKKIKDQLINKADDAAQIATGQLLKIAWLNIISPWGLISLVYINLHVFLRWVLGERFFCKLGEEWIPKQTKAIAGEAGKLAGKPIGIVEVMVLILVDLVVGAIIVGFLALIVMIVSWMSAGIFEKGWIIIKGIYELGWGGVSALMELF